MGIIVLVIGIFIIYIIFVLINNFVDKRNQNIRDNAAKEVLNNFNYPKERDDILNITKGMLKEEYKCPLCKGLLKPRIGKFGQFWGCSSYPRCKFTRN